MTEALSLGCKLDWDSFIGVAEAIRSLYRDVVEVSIPDRHGVLREPRSSCAKPDLSSQSEALKLTTPFSKAILASFSKQANLQQIRLILQCTSYMGLAPYCAIWRWSILIWHGCGAANFAPYGLWTCTIWRKISITALADTVLLGGISYCQYTYCLYYLQH